MKKLPLYEITIETTNDYRSVSYLIHNSSIHEAIRKARRLASKDKTFRPSVNSHPGHLIIDRVKRLGTLDVCLTKS